MSRSALSLLSAALALALPMADAVAQSASIPATVRGRIERNTAGDDFQVQSGWLSIGTNFVAGHDFRNYFAFDLSSVPTDAIFSTANLIIGETSTPNPVSNSNAGTHSVIVTTVAVNLLDSSFNANPVGGNAGSSAGLTFAAIGAGSLLNTVNTNFYTTNTVATMPITGDFLVALEDALGGNFAFGMKVSDEDAQGANLVFTFGGVTNVSARLFLEWTLPIPPPPPPEPSGGGSGSFASYQARNQQATYRHQQAQQANARRVAQQQRLAQHRRNQ